MNRFLQALNNRAGPLIMGVINTTPDSFSDGGQFIDAAAAIAHAHALVAAGADLLDLGGESTRPGAEPVGADEEIDRVLPVLQALAKDCPIPISIDTRKPEVARAAIAAGASCWNDVSALGFSPDSLKVAAALDVPVVLMHAQGEPKTMQVQPSYRDVTSEVLNFLFSRLSHAVQAGIKLEHIILDPGIGFGKTLSHNLTLMRDLPRLVALGRPVLVGASRKRFIEALAPGAAPDNRLGGSLAAALFAARQGAAVLRVHDVAETRQALRVQAALFEERLD